jgi:hypothetical protein
MSRSSSVFRLHRLRPDVITGRNAMNVSTFLTSCAAVLMVSASVVPATAQVKVDRTNLVSDIPGLAKLTDPALVNAWGISFGTTSPFWISDNGTGLATLYSVPDSGPPSVSKLGLTVTIPPTAGGTTSAPTGQVFNGGAGFAAQFSCSALRMA